jgi:serine/threonine protein kinase
MSELSKDFAGRYRIEAKIGQGGMGIVYRAFDLQLNRAVALKVLTDTAAKDPDSRTRFLNEISTTASLTHLYIVPVYEGGIEEDRFYFTMELIEGSDLGQLCRSGPLDPKRAIQLLRQVCAALQYIHEQGYVHRDVKPTNVLVWEPGDEWESAKLADFGIARALAKDSQLTKAPPGSLPYMAPEAVEWQPQTPLSDQYALGIMAFEMLCGRRPFTDDSLPRAHCDQPVPHVADLVEGLPATTCKAVERALAKDPGDRFEDVTAFATALDEEPLERKQENASPAALPSSAPLQEEIVAVLEASRRGWVQVAEIAREINSRRRDNREVSAEEVDRRTKTFSRSFRRRGSAVQLR